MYENAYDYAISNGKSSNGAQYYANTFCRYVSDVLQKEYDEDPERFEMDHEGRSFEEIAQNIVYEEIKAYENAKSWNHSEEWAYFYADDIEETKDGAYDHIRTIAPETVYSEAFNEYIARGFSVKYATLIAKEIEEPILHDQIDELEDYFVEYERLYNKAKSKNKSDEFADYFANYCCCDISASYGWAIAILRETLLLENKSSDYINDVIHFLDKYDDINEETLIGGSEDYYKIAEATGYANGKEYAIKNNIQKAYEFAELLAKNTFEFFFYGDIHPYEEMALYRTIIEYNIKADEKLPITQSQLDLLDDMVKKIKKADKENRKWNNKY